MASLFSLVIFLQLGGYFLVASCTPFHPRDPTITSPALLKRDMPPEFVGWYSTKSDDQTVLKPFFTSDNFEPLIYNTYVAWCDNSVSSWESSCQSFSLYTRCVSNVLYAMHTVSTCQGSSKCDYNYVFTSSYSLSEGVTQFSLYDCMTTPYRQYFWVDPRTDENFSTYNFYISIPTPTPTPTPTPSPSSIPLPGSTSSASPSSSSNLPPSPTAEATSEPASKAWIAGPVVGSLAAIASAGLAFFLIRRRRRQNQGQAYEAAPQTSTITPQPEYGGSIVALPPPGSYQDGQGSGKSNTRMSHTTGTATTTWSMHSAVGSHSQVTAASMNDLPEFVSSSRT